MQSQNTPRQANRDHQATLIDAAEQIAANVSEGDLPRISGDLARIHIAANDLAAERDALLAYARFLESHHVSGHFDDEIAAMRAEHGVAHLLDREGE